MAQSHNYKIPPSLGPDTNYETWKNELEIWKLVTDVKTEKQALAVTLSLTGQARAKALEIDATQLNSRDGMNILLTALDTLFLQDEVDLAYTAYSDFERLRKEEDMSMSDFIIEYERRYNICRKYKMDYPDSVLAFKLLDNAGLSVKERQLVLTAASDRNFSSMKSALKRIFGDSSTSNTTNEIKIKEEKEEAFLVRSHKYHQVGKKSSNYWQSEQKGTNPFDRNGKRTRCAICESVFHWAKNCPHKRQNQEDFKMTNEENNEEECHFALFTKEHKTKNEALLMESFGCAIIDTACTKTVCGRRWYEQYVDQLEQKKKKKIKTSTSRKTFKFGNGKRVKSYMKATIPAQIGDTRCTIETEVVNVELPLLLSKESLKRANTVLDMSNDKATMFQQPIDLNYTSTGHYCINICNNKKGDKVYYKQLDGQEWEGPGTVIGQDGCVSFMRHGGTLKRVHQSKIQKIKSDLEQEKTTKKDTQMTNDAAQDCQQNQSDTGCKSEEISQREEIISESMSDLDTESKVLEEDDRNNPHDTEMDTSDTARAELGSDTEVDAGEAARVELGGNAEVDTGFDPAGVEQGQITACDRVDTGSKISARVLSGVGGATEKGRKRFSSEGLQPKEYEDEGVPMDLTRVNRFVISSGLAPATDSDEAVMVVDEVSFENDKKEELDSWKGNQVYAEVEDGWSRIVKWLSWRRPYDPGGSWDH